jgi:septal ring factor EnvC (AmiA/AmiB activator)
MLLPIAPLACGLLKSNDVSPGRFNLDQRSAFMAKIETNRPQRTARSLQIATLIAELYRVADLLADSIKQQEEEARVSDRTDPNYPVTARGLVERRDNISATIRSLEAGM